MNTAPAKPRIALWFKYGPAEHAELFHVLPDLVRRLAEFAEVHYFGLRGRHPVPETIRTHAVIHHLPWSVDRTSGRDKLLKWILWYLCLPYLALRCRFMGVRLLFIDDYLPLGAPLARLLYGPNIAVFVADFLHESYAERHAWLKPVVRIVNAADLAAWRRLPLLFTKAPSANRILEERGVPAERIVTVPDPCDFNLYRPVDREAARRQWGYAAEHVVLAHHGILHPNKGNDRILQWLAPLMQTHPGLRFLLVGSGPELDRLQRLAADLGIAAKVRFAGWLPRTEDVNVALNAADIGLAMRTGSFSDNFHLTGALVHSLAVGQPVMAARLAGMATLVADGKNGFLFDPRDGKEFQEKMELLITNPALRAQMGAAALATARATFDMATIVDTLVNALKNHI